MISVYFLPFKNPMWNIIKLLLTVLFLFSAFDLVL